MIILKQMTVLFIIMIAGYLCRRKGILNDVSTKAISVIVVNIANPMLIINSAINADKSLSGRDLLMTAGISIAMYAVLLAVSYAVPKLLRSKPEDVGMWRVITVFSNVGFMGFPLISAVYGEEAMLYTAVFQIPFSILIYTWGISQIRGKAGSEGESMRSSEGLKATLSKVINIGIIAALTAVVIYLCDIKVPSILCDTIGYLADLTVPLSMLVIGDSFARVDIKGLFTNRKLLLFSLIKLIIIPVIWTFMIKALHLDPMLTGVCMVMISTPVASMPVMLAQQYDGNVELSSRGVVLTTLLSVLTMPLISMITGV